MNELVIHEHTKKVRSVKFYPKNGKYLISAGNDAFILFFIFYIFFNII